MSPIKSKQPKTTWTIQPRQVKKAQKVLGLKHSIKVRLVNGFWWGKYDVYPLHTVTLNSSIPRTEVSWTLWHELGHVWQCEHYFAGDGDAYLDASDVEYRDFVSATNEPLWDEAIESYSAWRARYKRLPMEREADQIATRYCAQYPLIK